MPLKPPTPTFYPKLTPNTKITIQQINIKGRSIERMHTPKKQKDTNKTSPNTLTQTTPNTRANYKTGQTKKITNTRHKTTLKNIIETQIEQIRVTKNNHQNIQKQIQNTKKVQNIKTNKGTTMLTPQHPNNKQQRQPIPLSQTPKQKHTTHLKQARPIGLAQNQIAHPKMTLKTTIPNLYPPTILKIKIGTQHKNITKN